MINGKTFYQVLGVPNDAHVSVIRAARRNLAKKHHPDKTIGNKGAGNERMAEINVAWATLGDAAKRQQYDEHLRRHAPFEPGNADRRQSRNEAAVRQPPRRRPVPDPVDASAPEAKGCRKTRPKPSVRRGVVAYSIVIPAVIFLVIAVYIYQGVSEESNQAVANAPLPGATGVLPDRQENAPIVALGREQSGLPPCPSPYQSTSWTNCVGEASLPDGQRYVGGYMEGKYSGHGILSLPNGSTYVGEWRDGRKNGPGTIKLPNGMTYSGDWLNDQSDGQGTYTSANGTKYVGTFKDSQFNGQGTYTSANGTKYVGSFKDGQFNGQGTYTSPGGTKYIGEFRDGKLNGKGIEYDADGLILRSGTWVNGGFVGNR